MIENLSIALVQAPELAEELSEKVQATHSLGSVVELTKLLSDQSVDLIVFGSKSYHKKSFSEVFEKFHVPALVYGKIVKTEPGLLGSLNQGPLLKLIEQVESALLAAKNQRENSELNYVMKQLTGFTNQVIHLSKDLFISETKKFFKENFSMERCHWVEVKEASAKLPPILKLKAELKNQGVDQSTLISLIESCHQQIMKTDSVQMWKNHDDETMGFLWIFGSEDVSQCLVFSKIEAENFCRIRSFFQALVPFLERRWQLCLSMSVAQDQIYKDSLTNLFNQKFLGEVLDKKIEENNRYNTPFSVLFIDVDHFKRVNDSLGHQVGSGVLAQVGDLLLEQIRSSDYAFRYGGDEFILLLSHTEGEDAENVAERVRKRIENHQFSVNEVDVKITVSIGLAFYPEHAQTAQEIVKIADEAMYYGKNKSRNIVYKAS